MIINLNLLQLLTLPELAREKGLCHLQIYKTGDILFKEGDPVLGIFLIKSGKVDIKKNIIDNEKITLYTLGPGDILGEIFFGAAINKYFTDAEVIEKTIIVFYESKKLEEVLLKNTEISLQIYLELIKVISLHLRYIDNVFREFFIRSLNPNKG